MTPRTGRPPIENPKADRITVRLTEYQQSVLSDCAEKFGTTKADIICRGIDLMRVEKDNDSARQLLDAIVILNDLVQKDRESVERQIKQVEKNFEWYVDSIKK